MNNRLIDLNDHLFKQLDRLNTDYITPEKMTLELERSKGLIGISREIIANARLRMDAEVAFREHQITDGKNRLGFADK